MEFVTIKVALRPGFASREVSMPGATTILYAAKRAAEELGLDPDEREWCLVYGRTPLYQDDLIADHAEKPLWLFWK